MITPEQAIVAALLVCLGGALLALVPNKRRAGAGWLLFAAVACSSALVLLGTAKVLISGAGPALKIFAWPRLGIGFRFYVDGLSAIFLALVALVALMAAFYSIEYMRHHHEHGLGRYHANFLLFVAGMYGLLSTTDTMWVFLLFWQLMTVPGYALIRHEWRRPENALAAGKFFWMMQLACAAAMLGAGLLADGGITTADGQVLMPYDLESISHHLPAHAHESGLLTGIAFALFLAGFGIKLGMWPFGQVWLPDAHPAAPSPVSAMLSGVMIKTGVYGLLRTFLWLIPVEARGDFPITNWGLLIAVLGTVTLFTGTVRGLLQEQSKRLLAFSTIGQAGYILLGLGVCLTCLGQNQPAAAALASVAFCGTVFHAVNHGLFKSLLFLNAGSVLHATGTQDLNKLGGLMRLMPVTAVAALIGSFSIAGVPLSSGFASKWTLMVSAIQGGSIAWLLPVCAAIAILTSAITLALFIKFFGVVFLSRTSALVTQRAARHPHLEVGWTMRLPQIVLAAGCILFGLLPGLPLSCIQRSLEASRQGLATVLADAAVSSPSWLAGGLNASSAYTPLALALVMAIMFAIARFIARLAGAPRRRACPWLCGYAVESEAHRYRSGGLYAELKGWLAWPGPSREGSRAGSRVPAVPKPKEAVSWSLEKN